MPSGVASFSHCARAFALVTALLVAVIASPRSALAWVDLTVSNDDVKVTIDATGKAIVEHKTTLLVSGGPLREIVVKGVDADATVMPDGYVTLDKTAAHGAKPKAGSEPDGPLPIAAQRVDVSSTDDAPARTDLKIALAPGDGIRRGTYVLFFRYQTDLDAQGAIGSDGASSVVRWTGPSWDDGLDATKAAFEIPAAPTQPRAVEPDESAGDNATVLSELHRGGRTDVLELTRPYAPKGERVVWALRTDPRAFGRHGTGSQAPRAAPPAQVLRGLSSPRDGLAVGFGVALFALVAGLVAAKSIEVTRLARERASVPRPLLPLPTAVRASLAGAVFVLGVYLQATQTSSLPGAIVVGAVALFAAHRSPKHKAALRGPGQWLYVSAQEALRTPPSPPRAWLDASTWRGRFSFLLVMGSATAGAVLLWPMSHYYAVLIWLDVAPLFAVFFTGRLSQIAPDPASAPVALFRRVARLVQRSLPTVRVAPRVRIPAGAADADELRVTFVPEKPVPGLVAVELAAGYASGLGGYVLFPEICIRFQTSSPCEARAMRLTEPSKIQRGRRAMERVLVLSPKLPTARMTAELAIAALAALTTESKAPASKPRQSRAPTKKTALAA